MHALAAGPAGKLHFIVLTTAKRSSGEDRLSLFFDVAAAGAAGAIAGAASAVGAADAFSAAFLRFADITGGKADDGADNEDNQIINRSHSYFFPPRA